MISQVRQRISEAARERVLGWLGGTGPAEASNESDGRALKPRHKSRRQPRTSFTPAVKTRWLQSDLEVAVKKASSGDMAMIGQLYRAMARDGTIQGGLKTRTGGLVQLPKAFRGTEEALRILGSRAGEGRLFDKIFPRAELELIAADGVVCGVGVGEFVQEEGKKYPVLTRLDPEFLLYRQHEDQWYYRSREGLVPVTPGDGRWVLYTPGGRYEPWNRGNWQALGRAFIAKEHAFLHRENYAATLANPAIIGYAPQGANEAQKNNFFRQLMRWGANAMFGLTPGWEAKLLESNGRGYEVFQQIIAASDKEEVIAISGQEVTTTGGVGFANASVFDAIRSDLIKGDGETLAECLNEQALPHVVADYVGEGHSAAVSWDTTPPPDLKAEADATRAVAGAVQEANAALSAYGIRVDARELATRHGIPIEVLEAQVEAPSVALAPTDVVKVVKVNEARASAGLGPLTTATGEPDPRGEWIVSLFAAELEAKGEARGDVANTNDSQAVA